MNDKDKTANNFLPQAGSGPSVKQIREAREWLDANTTDWYHNGSRSIAILHDGTSVTVEPGGVFNLANAAKQQAT